MTETIKQHLIALVGDSYPEDRLDAAIALALTIVGALIGRPVTEEDDEIILVAVAMVAANILAQGEGGPIISETIGSYSYTRSSARSRGLVTDEIEDLLRPWLTRQSVYSVTTPTPSMLTDEEWGY